MYLLIISLPFAGFFSAGLLGRYLGSLGSTFITVNCTFLSFLFSMFAFYEVTFFNCPTYVKLLRWINSEFLNLDWGFMFDTLTVSMCVIITFVSFLIHLYSAEYMSHDPHLPRFLAYLSLFTIFMLILVTADNYVQMFVGWEGVGLASYLLINFWYTRIQANKAAIKAMVINRIGDFCLLIGAFLIYTYYKAFDYATVAALTPLFKEKTIYFLTFDFHLLSVIGFFFFLAAAGKSAQLGLHTWLPDAMEGPTPVSALIHAATMVTAGVFLIARSSFIYEYTHNILGFIAVFGATTSFFAASTGLAQNDIKRVIAYSTCSQLGYMIFACGLSNYAVGFFHLSNHAFFKALLFLSAGSVIHAINDEQDIRKMGGLKNLIPFTYSAIMVGSLSLAGFPFLSGFYSKDLILEIAFGQYTFAGYFSYCLGVSGAFLTAFYSMRLLYLTFLSKPNGSRRVILSTRDSGEFICVALGCLVVPSVLIGYLTKDMVVGLGSSFFGTSVFVNLINYNSLEAEFIDPFYKLLPVIFSITSFFFAWFLYHFSPNSIFIVKTHFRPARKIYSFLNRKWFFDKIFNEYVSQFFLKLSFSISYKFMDRGIFEMLGPTGLAALFTNVSNTVHKLHSGHLYHSNLIILMGASAFFCLREFYVSYQFLMDYRLIVLVVVLIFYEYYNSADTNTK